MDHKNSAARVLLALYAAGSLAVVFSLLLDIPGTGELAGTTSGKVLAAALFALRFGAAMAVLAILTRFLFHDESYDVDPAWMVLPFAAGAPVLLAVFYPRAPAG